jgi:N-acetylmuramoyl-L-alanine amidase
MSSASFRRSGSTAPHGDGARHLDSKRARLGRNLITTVPIVVISSLAITLNLASPAQAAPTSRRVDKPKSDQSGRHGSRNSVTSADQQVSVAAGVAPRTYTVVSGDTISGIAGRFGLSTASVLALNGLSWKSLIFPGQSLVLTESAAAAQPAPQPAIVKYTVVSGDTISGIAAAHGLSTQAVLSANGLSRASLIFPGQSITLPSEAAPAVKAAPAPTPHPAPAPAPTPVPAVTPMTEEMRQNAAIILAVGRRDGVSDYGIIIALAAAMQESGLVNHAYGDKDSLGLFQQRPSTGWGTPAQIMNPTDSALAFFGGPNNPNAGRTRGLLDIPGWQRMTVTQAAQAVQISAYPDAYAKWETSARVWLSQLEQ